MKGRKIISVILLISMMFLMISCKGGKEQAPSGVDAETAPHITIALRSGVYSDVVKSCLLEFEEENQVICDVLELGEEELHSGILDGVEKDHSNYDLCMVDGSWAAEFAAKQVMTSLSAEGYDLDDDIIEATKGICMLDGEAYLAPYYGNVTVLLFNKKVVKSAGADGDSLTSLEAMKKVCESAKAKGNLGFMYRGDSANNYVVDFLPILASFGGWVVDENNNPTVDTEEFRQAMEFYMELIATGKAENRDNLIIAIANGAAAMAVGWPGWYTPTAKSSSDYIALTGKVSDSSTAYNANVYGIWTLGVPWNSANKELSVKLLKHLMDPEVQKKSVEYGGVPCRYSCFNDEKIMAENPPFKAVFNALQNGVYRPYMEKWPEFYGILGPEMANIIDGKKTIDEGLADAQKNLEEMLNN